MKMIRYTIIISTLLTLLFSCEEYIPAIDFKEEIKGRSINLSNKVGESFYIQRGNDTIAFSLSYDKSTDLNYIIKSSKDTIFVGTVTKRNELYLLNRALTNGNVGIHALQFTDSTVTGLETEWLQSSIIKNELDSGNYHTSIIDTIGGTTIKLSKKEGKEIFRSLIAQLKAEKIVQNVGMYQQALKEETDVQVSSLDTHELETNLIAKVYPNPFVAKISIELLEAGMYTYNVYDVNGYLQKTSNGDTAIMQLDLSELNAGQYILQVLDVQMKKIDQIRLIKKP